MKYYFDKIIKGKTTTEQAVEIATKVFFWFRTEIKALSSAKAGEVIECETMIYHLPCFGQHFKVLMPKIEDIIKSSNINIDIKNKWMLPANGIVKWLIINNENPENNIVIYQPDIKLLAVPKHKISQGQEVLTSDIVDIKEAVFDELAIDISKINSNSQMYFILNNHNYTYIFADFNVAKNLSLNSNKENIGKLFRYLFLHELYHGNKIAQDWFPFIEIINDINDTPEIENFAPFVTSKMPDDRIHGMKSKWWNNKIFLNRKEIIEQGIQAYINKEYVNCMTNIIAQVDGIMRDFYSGTKKGNMDIAVFRGQIIGNAKKIANKDKTHPFFYADFENFINTQYFSSFDETQNDHIVSRNTICHGKLSYKQFTQAEALKLLLTLDQVYYYSLL